MTSTTQTWDRCTRCIQSASFPKIKFDEDGVCNFCRRVAGGHTEDKAIERARAQIESLMADHKAKARSGEYDALMCFSGGKDSTYVLKLAVQEYGLRVLSFTLDNGFLSDSAFDNIHRVVDHLGVDHITFRPSGKQFKKVIKASALKQIYNPKTLTRISSVCNSCISVVNTTALRYAMEKNIPFILAGFTLGQIPANGIVYENNYRFLAESREDSLVKLRKEAGDGIDSYFCIPDASINAVSTYPKTLNLLCLENITEQQIIENVKTMGWSSPGDVDGCSSNCRLNTFNNYAHERSFGYNPYELELSHLIRKGLMAREEALEKIKDQPHRYLESIMSALDISEAEMDALGSSDDAKSNGQ